jgi:hypothetical protein
MERHALAVAAQDTRYRSGVITTPAWDLKGRPPLTPAQRRVRLAVAIAFVLGLGLLGVRFVSAIFDLLSFHLG